MSRWKLLGLAGLAGVAATGAVIARDERRRRAVGPDDVRAALHARLAEAGPAPVTAPPAARSRFGSIRRLGLRSRVRRRVRDRVRS